MFTPNTPVWQGIRNSLARQTDQLQRIDSILLKKLHFNSSNGNVFLYFCSERWRKIHFIALNQFQTMEDKRSWDCVKSPTKQLLRRTLVLMDNFLFNSGFIPSSPTSPSNVVLKKSTHFHPFCSKFNFVWGWRGGVTSFSNITGKVPTLLTSIVWKPLCLEN